MAAYRKDTMEAAGLLRRLIATPSISRDEDAAAGIVYDYLEARRREMNGAFTLHRHGNNVWCIGGGTDKPAATEGKPDTNAEDKPAANKPAASTPSRGMVLLNAHIDTVRPVAGWRRDPFVPSLEGDCLYGLGSNDCGGGLVSLMQVFLSSPEGLVFLASAEEEVSGRGGIESVLPMLPEVGFAIVGEPTGMQPAVAEKGLMVIDAVAHGRAGHAARDEGDNAIYRAMRDISWLSEWQFPRQTELLGPVKNTVTIVKAGTQHNVIPDRCEFTIDVRSNECYTNEEILAVLREHLASELTPRSTRLSSSAIPLSHPFVQACIAEGLKPFGSPTLSDQALMPFPSLKIGPGDSARSHTADEFIRLAEIDHAIRLYARLLSQCASPRRPKPMA